MSVRVRGEIVNVDWQGYLVFQCKDLASITEIEGLDKLTNLKGLTLDQNDITKIEGLGALRNLEILELDANRIEKIEGLETLVNLKWIRLSNNKITKITGLDKLSGLQKLELDCNQITKIEGLDKLPNLKEISLYGNQITKIEGLDTLVHLQRLDLGDNQITKLEGLKTLTELKSLSLGANPITWPEGLSEDSSDAEVVAYCQGHFPPQGPLPRPAMADETTLLRKFKDILVISQEVRKAEVAEYLGLTEKDLFAKLVSWGALNLGFKVRGDVIVVDDLDAFVKALDQQFKQWEEGKGSKESKV